VSQRPVAQPAISPSVPLATGPSLAGVRVTRAIIDLEAVAGNVRALRSAVPPTTRLMAVVKADGYGHGATWVARTALDAGASALGVATVGEGRALRAADIRAPIVLLGSIDPTEAAAACRCGLEITVAGLSLLDAVQRAAREAANREPVSVHLKIDTGLRRYGALPEEAGAIAARIAQDPMLRLAGICTHLASADEPAEPFTSRQLHCFHEAVGAVLGSGIQKPPLHAANSAGLLTGQAADLDMVRPGIAIYGVSPSAEVALLPGMRAAMAIESRITRLIPIAPGDSVGYNRTYRASRSTRGALVPIGYADGYPSGLSGRSWVGLGGRRAAVLGRVSMDQLVIEIPDGVTAQPGETVQILGGDRQLAAPTVFELAELVKTNAYEVLAGIRRRVPRVYVRAGTIVAVREADQERGE
jgi:alanine racemase